MKYKFSKKIMYSNLIICMLLVLTILLIGGFEPLFNQTQIISCPNIGMSCKVIVAGEEIILLAGEEITFNEYNQNILNIANYGVWIMIILSLITNHIIYNKGYFKNIKIEVE